MSNKKEVESKTTQKKNKKPVKEKTPKVEEKKEEPVLEEIKEEPKIEKTTSKKKVILSWIITIAICFSLAYVFTHFVVRSVEVDGYSMSATLSDGDKAITDALFFRMGKIKRFDIVTIKRKNSKDELVKRVIALPGETIEYKSGVLYINDEVVEETFISDAVKSLTGKVKKKTLGDNEYYVMGDNRGNSLDSRSFGVVYKSEITGRGLLRFMVCTSRNSENTCNKRKFVWPSTVK